MLLHCTSFLKACQHFSKREIKEICCTWFCFDANQKMHFLKQNNNKNLRGEWNQCLPWSWLQNVLWSADFFFQQQKQRRTGCFSQSCHGKEEKLVFEPSLFWSRAPWLTNNKTGQKRILKVIRFLAFFWKTGLVCFREKISKPGQISLQTYYLIDTLLTRNGLRMHGDPAFDRNISPDVFGCL